MHGQIECGSKPIGPEQDAADRIRPFHRTSSRYIAPKKPIALPLQVGSWLPLGDACGTHEFMTAYIERRVLWSGHTFNILVDHLHHSTGSGIHLLRC